MDLKNKWEEVIEFASTHDLLEELFNEFKDDQRFVNLIEDYHAFLNEEDQE